jgi:putative transposase
MFRPCAIVFSKTDPGTARRTWLEAGHEGEVLESFATKTCDKKAASKFMKEPMRQHDRLEVLADRVRSYGAAPEQVGAGDRQETGSWSNKGPENLRLPFRRRERTMIRFWRMLSLKK